MRVVDRRPHRMARRRFLAGLASLPAAWVAWPASADADVTVASALRRLFNDSIDHQVAIGSLYLAKEPAEASRQWLAGHVCGASWMSSDVPVHALADRVRALRHDDFCRGDLVEIDGWLLARSEARLFALAALVLPA
jgi:hypothetical protein